MMALVVLMALIPAVDQTLKVLVRTRIGHRSLSLGVLGCIRVVQTEIWTMRALGGVSLPGMWVLWVIAAGASIVISAMVPAFGWGFGLLMGGALSHALEISLRGSICDYVCLRFWPAFNLADVALTIGALGLAFELISVVT